jgi:hypothetical protein
MCPQDNLRKSMAPQIEFCQEQLRAQNDALQHQLGLQQDFFVAELGKESFYTNEVMEDRCKQHEQSLSNLNVSADGSCS